MTKRARRRAVREHFGIEAFGVNSYTADAGDVVINEHDETGEFGERHEELYLVIDGRARFTIAGEELDAPAGTFVHVADPAVRRGAVAVDTPTTVLVVGARRGEPFRVSFWEGAAEFWPHYEAKDYEAAIAELQAVLEREPSRPGVLYNLACCESLAGRPDDALGHLRGALEINPGLVGVAKGDPDFDALRGDPDFEQLLSEADEPTPAATPASTPEPAFQTARLDELEALPVDDEGLVWRPVRRTFGIEAFGVNAYTAARAGDRVVEEHRETTNEHEELYFVLRGRARFQLDDKEVDAPAGTFIFVLPQTKRGAIAEEADTAVVGIGGRRGRAFTVSGWEEPFAAYGYRRLGDTRRGLEIMRETVARHPDVWQAHYHFACFSSLVGDGETAIEHLGRAVELDSTAATQAVGDEDFDSVRDDPRFQRLVQDVQ